MSTTVGSPSGKPASVTDTAVDGDTFRAIMGGFTAGVSIVTTSEGGAPYGLTTTAVCSVSADPPLLLVCIDRSSRTLPHLQAAGGFIVHFMEDEAVGTSSLFASKSADKFDRVSWSRTVAGNPLLGDDVLAWAECVTESETEMGDHIVIAGRITDGRGILPKQTARPLVYFNQMFGNWIPAGV